MSSQGAILKLQNLACKRKTEKEKEMADRKINLVWELISAEAKGAGESGRGSCDLSCFFDFKFPFDLMWLHKAVATTHKKCCSLNSTSYFECHTPSLTFKLAQLAPFSKLSVNIIATASPALPSRHQNRLQLFHFPI